MRKKSKYSECKNNTLKYLWETLDNKLPKDFGIDIVHCKREIKNRNYSVLLLMHKNEEIATITAAFDMFSYTTEVKMTSQVYEAKETKIVRYYKKLVSFIIDSNIKDDIVKTIEEEYDSTIFTSIIWLLNYRDMLHEKLECAWNEQENNPYLADFA